MVSVWMIIGLLIAAVSVSTLGAAFSVAGIGALFSGAFIAVCAMAISLEFAKFVLAAYLHQRWRLLNGFFKTYLTSAIVILSLITSMGIFGFLSSAYQSASNTLDAENIKLETLRAQQARNKSEIDRLNKAIDEIPATRVTRRLQARQEAEPAIQALIKSSEGLETQIGEANLKILAVKEKVGPLIYISRAFNMNIDDVVKYLILVFVTVFDPLAICLVIATSDSLETRRNGGRDVPRPQAPKTAAKKNDEEEEELPELILDVAPPSEAPVVAAAPEPSHPASMPPAPEKAAKIAKKTRAAKIQSTEPAQEPEAPVVTAEATAEDEADGEVIQMKFADD